MTSSGFICQSTRATEDNMQQALLTSCLILNLSSLCANVMSLYMLCGGVTVRLHGFDRVHLSVASLNLRAEHLHFCHQLCDLKTGQYCTCGRPVRCFKTPFLKEEKKKSTLPDCSGCPGLAAAPPSHPGSASGCCGQTPTGTAAADLGTNTHGHIHSEQQLTVTVLPVTPGERKKFYHKRSVSHLVAAWW